MSVITKVETMKKFTGNGIGFFPTFITVTLEKSVIIHLYDFGFFFVSWQDIWLCCLLFQIITSYHYMVYHLVHCTLYCVCEFWSGIVLKQIIYPDEDSQQTCVTLHIYVWLCRPKLIYPGQVNYNPNNTFNIIQRPQKHCWDDRLMKLALASESSL